MNKETISRARKKYLFKEDDSENVYYDDEEQEEIINNLAEKNNKHNEIYSIAISIASVILNLIFNYEIIANRVSFLSGFIMLLSWIIICCITTSFRQYTTQKYYVRVEDEDDYTNEKNKSDGNNTNSKYFKKNPLFNLKYLEQFQLLNSSSKYKRYDMSDDREVPISPFADIINYISVGLSILIVFLTIGFQNWWHINKLIPFIPLIMTIANIYASYIIDQTTTEINSLKTFEAPFKGA